MPQNAAAAAGTTGQLVTVTLLSGGRCIATCTERLREGDSVADLCARAAVAQCATAEAAGAAGGWVRCPTLGMQAAALTADFGAAHFRFVLSAPAHDGAPEPSSVRLPLRCASPGTPPLACAAAAALILVVAAAAVARGPHQCAMWHRPARPAPAPVCPPPPVPTPRPPPAPGFPARCPPLPQAALSAQEEEEAFTTLRQAAARTNATKFSDGVRVAAAVHEYEAIYARRIGPVRGRAARVLELGLGCEPGAAGRSFEFWRQWLRPLEMWTTDWAHLRQECLRWWDETVEVANFRRGGAEHAEFYTARMHHASAIWGDQGNATWLRQLAARLAPIDVVIDDGSHSGAHQILSFETLFPALRPGGIYVVEDLEANFLPLHSPMELVGRNSTFPDYVARIQYDLHVPFYRGRKAVWRNGHEQNPLSDLVDSVHCARYICIIQRRADNGFLHKLLDRRRGRSYMDDFGSSTFKMKTWPCRAACAESTTGPDLCRCH
eukprot:TRINITY_DN55953_c0_g1_i1.p1 TRINITY_DN55953_c0_g1~~TRINITY_DN55953_c0_g1_i1.p1  ORF type:complete len:524 (+),score=141.99 TRINITY_DN55953_c0_g1_i1:96-1574(+)